MRLAFDIAKNGCGGLKLLERRAAAIVVERAFVGKGEPPRRAIEEPHAERRFKALHVLADGGRRYPERVGSFGEAAGRDDLHKGGDAGEMLHAPIR